MKSIIGFTNVYYTLWNYTIEKTNIGEITKYYYVKNISKDINKVKKQYPDLEIDTELKGMSYFEVVKEINNDDIEMSYKLNFGKYSGLSLQEIFEKDPDYLIWLKSNTYSSNIGIALTNNEEFQKYLKQNQKNQKEKLNNIQIFKDIINIEITFKSNLKIYDSNLISLYDNNGVYDGKPKWDNDYEDEKENMYAFYYIDNYKPNLDISLRFKKEDIKLYLYKQYVYALPLINNKGMRIKNKTFKIKGKLIETLKRTNYIIQNIDVLNIEKII